MSEDKAILILDEMPKNCFFCPLQADIEWFGGVCSYDHYVGRRNRLSRHGNHNPSDESRPEWCPLRPLPKKNAETVDAIPIEWLKLKIDTVLNIYPNGNEETEVLCKLLYEWEKENEACRYR